MANTQGSIYDIEAKIERYNYLKNKKEDAASYCIENLCWSLLFATGQPQAFYKNNSFFKSRTEALGCFKKYAVDFFHCKKVHFFNKILLLIFYLFPYSYYLYRQLSPFHIRKD